MTTIHLTNENVSEALTHIQNGIEAGRTNTDVSVTALGVLYHVVEALQKQPISPWERELQSGWGESPF